MWRTWRRDELGGGLRGIRVLEESCKGGREGIKGIFVLFKKILPKLAENCYDRQKGSYCKDFENLNS